MTTTYESFRSLARPLLPVLQSIVARDLKALVSKSGSQFRVLDVGGRSSPYTCGLAADVSIMELPRQSDVQIDLKLGVDRRLLKDLRRRRSNITRVVLQDLVTNTLTAGSYDGISAIEVIEHVPEDRRFVEQARRLLSPKGWLYLTTPNGDYIKNEAPHHNPDHIRHYKKHELEKLLSPYFEKVEVRFAVSTGTHRRRGLRPFDRRRPLATLSTMASNLLNHMESRNVNQRATRTAHLIAIARCKKN